MGTGFQPVFVWVALGTNLGYRLQNMMNARSFLNQISIYPPVFSSLYETEPLGPADKSFYNAVAKITSFETPESLLSFLKKFEETSGRDPFAPRWSNRIIDLDIIAMQNVQIQLDWLQIPHKEYRNRTFVLVPLAEIEPEWKDPVTQTEIASLLKLAPESSIQKLAIDWNPLVT